MQGVRLDGHAALPLAMLLLPDRAADNDPSSSASAMVGWASSARLLATLHLLNHERERHDRGRAGHAMASAAAKWVVCSPLRRVRPGWTTPDAPLCGHLHLVAAHRTRAREVPSMIS